MQDFAEEISLFKKLTVTDLMDKKIVPMHLFQNPLLRNACPIFF